MTLIWKLTSATIHLITILTKKSLSLPSLIVALPNFLSFVLITNTFSFMTLVLVSPSTLSIRLLELHAACSFVVTCQGSLITAIDVALQLVTDCLFCSHI